MLIMRSFLKPNNRLCWKYFSLSASRHTISSSLLRNNCLCRYTVIRSNHDNIATSNVYKQLENEYYHLFLSKNSKYLGTIAFVDYVPEHDIPSDVDSTLNKEFHDEHGVILMGYLYVALKNSQESSTVYDDARFLQLCTALSSKIATLHESHILNLLKILTLWDESKRNESFFDMCRSIDKILLPNYKLWGFDRCLLIMDHFYRLQVLRYSETVWNCMKRIWRDPNRLTSVQAVHAMFLTNAHRVWHPAVHLYSLETYVEQVVYELSVEECAIMALAFFKTQHRIKNLNLIKLLYQKLSYRISNVDSIPLVSFLKLLRFCSHYQLKEHMRQLLGSLNGVVDKHPFICCTHIALLGTGLLIRDSKLHEKIAQRLINEITTVRMKDIERTLFALQTFNYESKVEPDVYKVALNELMKRKNDVFEYARPFYSAVTYLTLKGYYNFDLINFILSEDVFKKAFNYRSLTKYNCHINFLTISDSVKIDFPEYSGNSLNESLRSNLLSSQSWKVPVETSRKPLSSYDKILLQAKSLLHNIFGGTDFVHYTYVLPHLSRPDLVFRLKGDNPIKLPEDVLSSNYIHAKLPSEAENWYVVTCFGFNTVIHETNEPIGSMKTKLRHLKKLGYKVLCIEECEWLNKSEDERSDYLQQLLKNARLGSEVI